ncbi:MAG: hypothetical protein ACREN2_05575, partial [Candidatus Dormibacteria bacterium]
AGPHRLTRRRWAALAALAAAVVAVLVVTLTHITSKREDASCSVAQPVPSLPSRLRSLGGFDQPQDPADSKGLETFAAQAANAVAPGLIGTTPGAPVHVRAVTGGRPDALVIPLVGSQPKMGVSGLVSLLLDCAGRAYYSAVDDLTHTAAASPVFPAPSATDAAVTLGTAEPQLVYVDSPFVPLWRNPDTGATIAAFAA